ncbi:MAG: L-threonylcarbamoyladenylate synthase [Micrococcaceae bacterium]
MSKIFDLSNTTERGDGIVAAKTALNDDELVVFPTDTVYGVAADAFSKIGVKILLAAKARGTNFPPPVLISRQETAAALAAEITEDAQKLMDEFWPGPLTLIFKSQPSLTWDLGETHGTVALRVPDQKDALELLTFCGPLAVSSANRHGFEAATTIEQAHEQLGEAVAVYLDGGDLGADQESSTIVDTTQTPFKVVRAGALSLDSLQNIVPSIVDSNTENQVIDDNSTEEQVELENTSEEKTEEVKNTIEEKSEVEKEIAQPVEHETEGVANETEQD